ncbi:MAG: hypothetical protein KDB27_23330 [Planctomycetales bacterium]|nr:hypothetical protein [Planctomycetales bacterium]
MNDDNCISNRLQKVDAEQSHASIDVTEVMQAVRERRTRKRIRRFVGLAVSLCLASVGIIAWQTGDRESAVPRQFEVASIDPDKVDPDLDAPGRDNLLQVRDRLAELENAMAALQQLMEYEISLKEQIAKLEHEEVRNTLATTDDKIFSVSVAYDFGY